MKSKKQKQEEALARRMRELSSWEKSNTQSLGGLLIRQLKIEIAQADIVNLKKKLGIG